MPTEETYGQHIGRLIVANALRMPSRDVEWAVLPAVAAGAWMAEVVEIAALKAVAAAHVSQAMTALKGAAR